MTITLTKFKDCVQQWMRLVPTKENIEFKCIFLFKSNISSAVSSSEGIQQDTPRSSLWICPNGSWVELRTDYLVTDSLPLPLSILWTLWRVAWMTTFRLKCTNFSKGIASASKPVFHLLFKKTQISFSAREKSGPFEFFGK